MVREAEVLSGDPVIVGIDRLATMTTFEWSALLATDEPTDIDADAADVRRQIRQQGEHSSTAFLHASADVAWTPTLAE